MIKTVLGDLSLRLFVPFAFATFAINARAGALAFDGSGNLFAVEHWRSIAKFTGDGIQSIFASSVSNLSNPIDLVLDEAGNLFVVPVRMLDKKNGITPSIIKFSPDGVSLV
jgi:hypothetical protein